MNNTLLKYTDYSELKLYFTKTLATCQGSEVGRLQLSGVGL